MKGPLAGVSKTVLCVAANGTTTIDDSTALLSTRYDDGVTYDGTTGVFTALSEGVYELNINSMQSAAFSNIVDDSTPVWDGTTLSLMLQMPPDVGGVESMAPFATLFIPSGTDFDDFKKIAVSGSVLTGLPAGATLKTFIKHDATESFMFVVNFSFIKIADVPDDLT